MAQRGKTRSLDMPEHVLWCAALVNKDEQAIDELRSKLKTHIKSMAIGYGKGWNIVANELYDAAISKVDQVIATVDPQTTRDIPHYLRTVAYNAMMDFFRNRREEDVDEIHAVNIEDDGDDNAQPGFRVFVLTPAKKRKEPGILCASCSRTVDAKGNCQNPRCGNCPSYNPKNRVPLEKQVKDYGSAHLPINKSKSYTASPTKSFDEYFYALFDAEGVTHEVLQECGRGVSLGVSAMPGEQDRLLMTLYLWGHRPVDVAKKLNAGKPYVSQRLKKWFNEWNWDDNYVERVRLCLLVHNLVDIASKVRIRIKPQAQPELKRSLVWLRLGPKNEKSSSYGIFSHYHPGVPFFGFREGNEGPYEGQVSLQAQIIIAYQSALYKRVVTDERTKGWVGILPKDEADLVNWVNDFKRRGWGSNPRKNKWCTDLDDDDWDDWYDNYPNNDWDDEAETVYRRVEDIQ